MRNPTVVQPWPQIQNLHFHKIPSSFPSPWAERHGLGSGSPAGSPGPSPGCLGSECRGAHVASMFSGGQTLHGLIHCANDTARPQAPGSSSPYRVGTHSCAGDVYTTVPESCSIWPGAHTPRAPVSPAGLSLGSGTRPIWKIVGRFPHPRKHFVLFCIPNEGDSERQTKG